MSFDYTICLCSHNPIKEFSLIENLITKERCIIENSCINEFGSDLLITQLKK